MTVKIKKLVDDAVIPQYAHGADQDAGLDLCAIDGMILEKGVPTLVKTGLSIELPPGYEGQIRSRSGLALKHGIQVLNSPGTVDPSYRGELGVILVWNGHNGNDSYETISYDALFGNGVPFNGPLPMKTAYRYKINKGDRIAQLVVAKYEPVVWDVVGELAESGRGAGGFGSTGL
jgi:dUTP pyrophosphatase